MKFNFRTSELFGVNMQILKSDVVYSRDLSNNYINLVKERCIEFKRELRRDISLLTFRDSCNENNNLCIGDDNTKISPESLCPISGDVTTAEIYLHKEVIYIVISGCFNTNHRNEMQFISWILTNGNYIDFTFYREGDQFDFTNEITFDRYRPDKNCSNLCYVNGCDGSEYYMKEEKLESSSLGSSNIQLSVYSYAGIGIFIGICACVYFLTPLFKRNMVAPQ